MNRLAEYFSPATVAVLRRAQQYADNREESLATTHVVKALFEVDRTVAYDVLRGFAKSRLSLLQHPILQPVDEIPLLLEKAALYAQNYNFTHIEPEHLLLVIIDQKNLTGHKLLASTGIKIKEAGQKLAEWMFGVSLLQTADAGVLSATGNNAINPASTQQTETSTTVIERVTTDLTKKAKKNKLGHIVAREEEIQNLIRTLLRHKKNNPLLIGDPGVGKTALVHGLASLMAANKVPPALQNKVLLELSVASLVAGTVYRGQFEERVRKLMAAIQKQGNVILFIDEIHTINGAGSTEGALDLANILKPLLAQGDLSLIGATTYDEYSKHFSSDRALTRRFQTHFIDEPNEKRTIAMVKAAVPYLEKHHRVSVESGLVPLVVQLATRFLPDRPFPDKAIDILDEACAETHLKLPPDETVARLKDDLRKTLDRKYALIDAGKLHEAIKLRAREQGLMKQLLQAKDDSAKPNRQHRVTEDTVMAVVSRLAGIPASMVQASHQLDQARLEQTLHRKIVGQNAAITTVVQALGRTQAGFKKPHQPIASFIFIGPTGVGKTELAKTLAHEVFGSPQALIKIDMSELSERHTISQLVGSPKGYVGHDDGGTLVDRVRKNPYSVILLDEIEKAHPDVFNILLQILEDGVLTDTHGRQAHFRHSLIILTSNIGTEQWGTTGLGFQPNIIDREAQSNEELTEYFRPELLARFTTVVHFQPFTNQAVKQLIRRRLKETIAVLKNNDQVAKVAPSVIDWLAKQYDASRGARSIDDLVKTKIEDVLVSATLNPKHTSWQLKLSRDQVVVSDL